MRKYHIADILSATEIILALVLFGMTFRHTSADLAIWIFVAGELCDAFDGPAHRRWPYPDDGKHRWWRIPRVVQAIEHTSDILMIVACAFFLLTQSFFIKTITLTAGSLIAIYCTAVEIDLQRRLKLGIITSEERHRIIIRRRIIYLCGIAIGLFLLLAATSWPDQLKHFLVFVILAIGASLMIYKWDRLTESNHRFVDALKKVTKALQKRSKRS